MSIHVLSISDRVVEIIYSQQIKQRFGDVDLILSCGDLPYYYIEFIVSSLKAPVFFVRGNHDKEIEYSSGGPYIGPRGATNLHQQVLYTHGLILAGVEGSIRYSRGPYQYTQTDMWLNILPLIPRLLFNRLRYGRALDILVTHAAPWGIHDKQDWTHQGIHAFRWLLDVFQPAYHFHGHIHLYGADVHQQTTYKHTHVINSYDFQQVTVDLNSRP
jgi:Icc-related predicted phosphoesterase